MIRLISLLSVLPVLFALSAGAQEPGAAPDLWMVGVLRMEGASTDVELAAAALALSLREAGATGRVGQLPALRTDADKLHRLVLSAQLATQNLAP